MMAFLDKLKFWEKKDPEFDLSGEDEFSKDEVFGIGSETVSGNVPGMQAPNQSMADMRQPAESYSSPSYAPSYNAPQPMAQQPQFSQQPYHQKDLEVISAKLDAIRATLDSVNQRLSNLERMNRGKENW